MAKTHIVNCIGVMSANGKVLPYGTEVGPENFNTQGELDTAFDHRVKHGYLIPIKDFKAKVEKDTEEVEATAQRSKLVASYKKMFKNEPPIDASNDTIADAIKNKTVITT